MEHLSNPSRDRHVDDFAIFKGFASFLTASGAAPHQHIDSTFTGKKIT
jgi:hypothetical protein